MSSQDLKQDFLSTQARHVRQCRKEALFVALAWLATLTVVTLVVWNFGYIPAEERPETPPLILGIPAWAFLGVVTPWVVMVFVAWYFALFVLKDDEPFQPFPESSDESPKEVDS